LEFCFYLIGKLRYAWGKLPPWAICVSKTCRATGGLSLHAGRCVASATDSARCLFASEPGAEVMAWHDASNGRRRRDNSPMRRSQSTPIRRRTHIDISSSEALKKLFADRKSLCASGGRGDHRACYDYTCR